MGERTLNIEIQVGQLPGSKLVADYYAGAPQLARFFVGSPWDPAAYRRKLEDVDARFPAERRAAIAEAIRTTTPASAESLRSMVEGGAVFVTTGQQAGLFTGPLYTVYKILSAITLARALEPVLERPVLPLFWIASDDHDFAEIDHLEILDRQNELRRITLEGDAATGIPAGERVLGPQIAGAIAALAEALPPSELAGRLMERVRRCYTPDRTMSGAFADLVVELFRGFDLLLVDPRHPTLKRLAAPILARELERSEAHEQRLSAQTARLVEEGYHAQVSVLTGAANVFFEGSAGRERLLRAEAGWQLKGSGESLGDAQVRDLLEREPARFSPNVFLRPVVENALLPTVAYVGGPAEVAYFAQIGCLFGEHDVVMPVVFPRFSVRLVEAKVRKVLDKFDLQPEDFHQPPHELAARIAREEVPADVRDALNELRSGWSAGFDRLIAAAAAVDPTLKGPLQSARNTGFQQLGEAEKKVVQGVKRQESVALEQVQKAATNLFPHGSPQERVLGAVQYVGRYGDELLPAIADAMTIQLGAANPLWAGVECA